MRRPRPSKYTAVGTVLLAAACSSRGASRGPSASAIARAAPVAVNRAAVPAGALPALVVQGRSASDVAHLSFSADGRRLAAASSDGSVRIYVDGRLGRILHLPRGGLQRVALDPPGAALLLPYSAPAWIDLESGNRRKLDELNDDARRSPGIALTLKNGEWAHVGSAAISLFSSEGNPKPPHAIVPELAYPTSMLSAVVTPNDEIVVTTDKAKLYVWSRRDNRARWIHLKGSERPLGIAAAGASMVAHGTEQGIRLVDLRNGGEIAILGPELGHVNSLSASADGRRLFAQGGSQILGWDTTALASPRWSWTLDEPGSAQLAVSPGGERLAAALRSGKIVTFEVGPSSLSAPASLDGFLRRARHAEIAGEHLLIASDQHVSVWSLKTGKRTTSADVGGLVGATMAGNGLLVARAVDGYDSSREDALALQVTLERSPTLHLPPVVLGAQPSRTKAREPASGLELPLIGTSTEWMRIPDAHLSAISPGAFARGFLQVGVRGEPYILNLRTGAKHASKVESSWTNLVSMSRSGEVALSGTTGGWVVWRLADGEVLATANPGDAVAISRDGTELAAASAFYVSARRVGEPALKQQRWWIPDNASVSALAYTAENLLVAGTSDGRLFELDEDTPRALGRVDTPIEAIWPANGDHRAAVATTDGSVVVWDLKRGEPLASLLEFADEDALWLTPDGFVSGSVEALDRVSVRFDSPLAVHPLSAYPGLFRPDEVLRRLEQQPRDWAPVLKRPPRLELAALATSSVSSETLVVRARSSPLAAVRALAEGSSRSVEAKADQKGEVTLELPLEPGPNRFALVAYDAQGFSSPARTLDVEREGVGREASGLFVIAVGISRYPSLSARQQLRVADDDARAFGAFFARHGATSVQALTDDEATVAAIDRALASLSRLAPVDRAVVLFAGHGVRTASGETVLLTSAATTTDAADAGSTISWARIEAHLRRTPARVLVLVDACHAGSLSTELLVPNADLAAALTRSGRSGTLVFAASRGTQLSREGAWTGVFTGAVLDVLSDAREDRDRDGYIDADELIHSVTTRVSSETHGKQVPWVMRRELFGGFKVMKVTP
jgi:WD40 repeat protein